MTPPNPQNKLGNGVMEELFLAQGDIRAIEQCHGHETAKRMILSKMPCTKDDSEFEQISKKLSHNSRAWLRFAEDKDHVRSPELRESLSCSEMLAEIVTTTHLVDEFKLLSKWLIPADHPPRENIASHYIDTKEDLAAIMKSDRARKTLIFSVAIMLRHWGIDIVQETYDGQFEFQANREELITRGARSGNPKFLTNFIKGDSYPIATQLGICLKNIEFGISESIREPVSPLKQCDQYEGTRKFLEFMLESRKKCDTPTRNSWIHTLNEILPPSEVRKFEKKGAAEKAKGVAKTAACAALCGILFVAGVGTSLLFIAAGIHSTRIHNNPYGLEIAMYGTVGFIISVALLVATLHSGINSMRRCIRNRREEAQEYTVEHTENEESQSYSTENAETDSKQKNAPTTTQENEPSPEIAATANPNITPMATASQNPRTQAPDP